MTRLKALIADDEPPMCEELQTLLQPDFDIVCVCHDGEQVLYMTAERRPDVVFLDIQMPGLNGLEVAQFFSRQEHPPLVVFVTAYSEFALPAFAVNAVGYILKPFDAADVQKIVRNLHHLISLSVSGETDAAGESQKPAGAPGIKKKFCAYAEDDRLEIIDIGRIKLVYAQNKAVYLRTIEDEVFMVKMTLQTIEQELDASRFFRCHRNCIVNIDQVKQLKAWFNRGYLLVLKGEQKLEIPVSRTFVKPLRDYIIF